MPIQRCEENGSPGWRWGESGKCYTYTKGDSKSEGRAKAKARAQGAAARSSGYEGGDS